MACCNVCWSVCCSFYVRACVALTDAGTDYVGVCVCACNFFCVCVRVCACTHIYGCVCIFVCVWIQSVAYSREIEYRHICGQVRMCVCMCSHWPLPEFSLLFSYHVPQKDCRRGWKKKQMVPNTQCTPGEILTRNFSSHGIEDVFTRYRIQRFTDGNIHLYRTFRVLDW